MSMPEIQQDSSREVSRTERVARYIATKVAVFGGSVGVMQTADLLTGDHVPTPATVITGLGITAGIAINELLNNL